MSTTQQKITVMQAYADGQQIEKCDLIQSPDKWVECLTPLWNWVLSEYRIKKIPREFAVVIDKYGTVVGACTTPNGYVEIKDVKSTCYPLTSVKVREVIE